MITLYHRTDCPFCWKVRIALHELGLEFESVVLELGEMHPFVAANSPTQTVPVMVDGDIVIWESSVILDYLDRRYANGQLIPTNAAAEARVRLLQTYSDKVVGACLRDIVFEKRSKPERDWDGDLLGAAEDKWQACQSWLEEQLGDGTFFGDGLSAADCALAARFGVAEAYGIGVGDQFTRLNRWFAAVTARESWQQAFPESFIRPSIEIRDDDANRESCAVR